MALMIRFHNTLGGALEPFCPLRPGEVGLYTCGPTVYDYPHIGNWRAYVFEDVLKRFLTARGFRVKHVMNITDVDDKTIKGAAARGVPLSEYTRPFIEAFIRDLAVLNIRPADHYPRATEHIPEMVALIKRLLERGYAYKKDGSVYFSIAKFPPYGRLSKIGLDDLKPGRRGDADEYEKESVHDFALWKAAKEGEPFWETDLGPGRPGWHVECSAMSSRYLGPTFDIHCGGVDNIFPHHENEIAQSEAANGVPFVRTWLHCHHLIVDGEKMSKSKGNVYRLDDILAKGYKPLEVRFLLLSTHYRKMLNFTFEALDQACSARKRLLDFLYELDHVSREGPASPEVAGLIVAAETAFLESLDDDLNISEAFAALFGMVKSVNILLKEGRVHRPDSEALVASLRKLDEVLGVLEDYHREIADAVSETPHMTDSYEDKVASGISGAAIQAKIDERQKAREAKDFKRADEIRRELLEQGILLEDTKDGVRWKRIPPARS